MGGKSLQKYIYIMIGGALGAVLRLLVKNTPIWNYFGNIPLNTLLINITGCFLLALFLVVALEIIDVDANVRIGVSTGFLGAFTTFSSLCKENVLLMLNGDFFSAISYITISIVLGLAASFLGVVLARKVIAKMAGHSVEKLSKSSQSGDE